MLGTCLFLSLQGLFFSLRLGQSGSFPRPLKPEEEKIYIAKSEAGDLDARNILIEHNLRLVAHMIKKFYTPQNDPDELISIGTIGLIKGVATFRSARGVKLATYCSRCVENELLMFLRNNKKHQKDISLSEHLDADAEGNAISLIDVIRVEDNLLDIVHTKDACAKLRLAVERVLNPRERRIIALRYGLHGEIPKTQREIAQLCGISRS